MRVALLYYGYYFLFWLALSLVIVLMPLIFPVAVILSLLRSHIDVR
jgi:hypothetical protein